MKTARLLDRSREELDQALRELRDLARGIHPAVLGDRGLRAAVEALAERAPLPVEVVSNFPDRTLPEQVELAAYFVVSEALTNIAKHASATKASVALAERDGRLTVEVRDDGVGGADLDRGTGLRGLAERVAAIDGRLEIDSKPGQGTIVRAGLPCPEPALKLAPVRSSLALCAMTSGAAPLVRVVTESLGWSQLRRAWRVAAEIVLPT